jgi:hypothetical protein
MIAFHGDPSLKAFVLAQLAAHRKADRLVKGVYWDGGRGCAVGCTLEAVRLRLGMETIEHSSHALYEETLGIPVTLANLEDRIFERLPKGRSQQWPERFVSAIRPGADLEMVWPQLALWMLETELPRHLRGHNEVLSSIKGVATLYREWLAGNKPDKARWRNAGVAAAAHAATDAADYATAAAAHAANTEHIAPAAYAAAAAVSAAHAANTAHIAPDAAAYAAAAAAAAAHSGSAALVAAYRRMADKLIELLEAA